MRNYFGQLCIFLPSFFVGQLCIYSTFLFTIYRRLYTRFYNVSVKMKFTQISFSVFKNRDELISGNAL